MIIEKIKKLFFKKYRNKIIEKCATTVTRQCPYCSGAEWLWETELPNTEYNNFDDTKYSCINSGYYDWCILAQHIRSLKEE